MFARKRQIDSGRPRGNRCCAWFGVLLVLATSAPAAAEQGATVVAEGGRAQAERASEGDLSPPQDARRPQDAPTILQVAFQRLPPVMSEDMETLVAPLTLAELEQMALANNPSLSVAGANVDAAQGRQVQAGLYPNPVIGYKGEEIGEGGTAGMQGGFVGQQFITGGKLRLDRAKAGQAVQESLFLLDAQQLRVLNDVRLRFYDSLVAQQQVELTGELVSIGEQLADFSQRLLAAQQLSKNDVLQAEIEVQESEILSDNAKHQQTEAWRRLAAVIGASELEPQPLAGQLDREFPSYDWNESYARVVGMNPELSAAEARVRQARLAIQRARRQNVPDVDVTASAGHKNSSHYDVAAVQIGFPLPIINRNQGNIYAAESELIAAQNNVRRLELQLQDRLAVALRRFADARQQATRYKQEILPRAQKSLDLVTRGYASGQVDFLTLLTSQRTYIRVNLAYLNTLAELWQASTLIEGQLLSGSLEDGR